jgi:tetratricopeptide (TPR) repeat protein
MKRLMQHTLLLVLLLFCSAFCTVTFAAQKPASSDGKQTQPAGKRVLQPKTQAEFNDYKAAYAISGGAAAEKAADDFAAKYPASELRSALFSKAMHEYQTENNGAKVLSTGQKVLQIDPDDAVALVLSANVLSDSLSESDPDRDNKVAEIRKYGAHALQLMDAGYSPMANATPEQVEAYKKTLQALAHSALGIASLKTGDDPRAEKELKAASQVNPGQPDPFIWYHLTLAQDHQKKYDEALVSVKQAIQNAASNQEIGDLAKGEQARLLTLTGGASPSPEKPAAPAPK